MAYKMYCKNRRLLLCLWAFHLARFLLCKCHNIMRTPFEGFNLILQHLARKSGRAQFRRCYKTIIWKPYSWHILVKCSHCVASSTSLPFPICLVSINPLFETPYNESQNVRISLVSTCLFLASDFLSAVSSFYTIWETVHFSVTYRGAHCFR